MSGYEGHLAKIQEKTSIHASEDIVTDQGMVLAKSGTKINEKMCENILKFKLMKPLEETIFIANQLTAKTIFNEIVELLNQDSYLMALNEKIGNTKSLEHCCLILDNYSLLLQKLTVLKLEIPDVFQQSLLSAYLASLCAIIENKPQEEVEGNFLSGIIHDIGLLHIDRYIMCKDETLSATEWRKVQSHPIISYEILKRISEFPEQVLQAVLEHHENLDGTGYPKGSNIKNLGDLGQLISLLDNIIVIYNKKFKPVKRSLHDVIPISQMTMHSYCRAAVSSVFKVLKEVPTSPVAQDECAILGDLISFVEQQQNYINTIVGKVKSSIKEIAFTHDIKELHAIQNISLNILVIINSAGLNETENLHWHEKLQQNDDNQHLYDEVEDTRLMQDEIIYQLGNYQKNANLFFSQNPSHRFAKYVQDSLQVFEDNHRPDASKPLKDYWQSLVKR